MLMIPLIIIKCGTDEYAFNMFHIAEAHCTHRDGYFVKKNTKPKQTSSARTQQIQK